MKSVFESPGYFCPVLVQFISLVGLRVVEHSDMLIIHVLLNSVGCMMLWRSQSKPLTIGLWYAQKKQQARTCRSRKRQEVKNSSHLVPRDCYARGKLYRSSSYPAKIGRKLVVGELQSHNQYHLLGVRLGIVERMKRQRLTSFVYMWEFYHAAGGKLDR